MAPTGSNSFTGRRTRRGRSLGETLDKKLASYAAAASAAGVGSRALEAAEVITRAASVVGTGLLLSAGPASARIVYTPAYTTVPLSISSPFPLDLNHDGITDFNFFGSPVGFSGGRLRVAPAQADNAVLGKIQAALSIYGAPFTCRVGSALSAGHPIGPESKFGAYQTMRYSAFFGFVGIDWGLTCGYWKNAEGRFLGLEFTVQGQKHFGWARLNVIRAGSATLTGYAYETEPNKPIRAGDMGPVADARVPEIHSAFATVATLRPGTLGLLALGSRGRDIWRKEV